MENIPKIGTAAPKMNSIASKMAPAGNPPRLSLAERLKNKLGRSGSATQDEQPEHDGDHSGIGDIPQVSQSTKPPRPVARPRAGVTLGESIPWTPLPPLESELLSKDVETAPAPQEPVTAQNIAGIVRNATIGVHPLGTSYGPDAWFTLEKTGERTVAEIHTQGGHCLVALDWNEPGHEFLKSTSLPRILLIEESGMYDYFERLKQKGITIEKGQKVPGTIGWARLIGTSDIHIVTPKHVNTGMAGYTSTRAGPDGSDMRPFGELPGRDFVMIIPAEQTEYARRLKPISDSVARHGLPVLTLIFRPFHQKTEKPEDDTEELSANKRAIRAIKADPRHCDLTKLADRNAGVIGIAGNLDAGWTNSEALTLESRLILLKESQLDGLEDLPDEEIEEVAIAALQAERRGIQIDDNWLYAEMESAIALFAHHIPETTRRQRETK
jgi:hypothetical protein